MSRLNATPTFNTGLNGSKRAVRGMHLRKCLQFGGEAAQSLHYGQISRHFFLLVLFVTVLCKLFVSVYLYVCGQILGVL